MNKRVLLVSLIALLLLGANPSPKALVRLTIVNKSGLEISVQLTSREDSTRTYYLTIQEGDKLVPTTQVYTIIPDNYSARIYFHEIWDPVYGFDCGSSGGSIDARRNVRMTVLPCTTHLRSHGEPSQLKFGR
jgi:hypothetical protein